MEIVETLLPGVGIRYELVTRAGRNLVVVVRRDGDVQLCAYGLDDPDEATEQLELQADEALAIAVFTFAWMPGRKGEGDDLVLEPDDDAELELAFVD